MRPRRRPQLANVIALVSIAGRPPYFAPSFQLQLARSQGLFYVITALAADARLQILAEWYTATYPFPSWRPA